MVAASILKANGFVNVANVKGGINQIKTTSAPIEVSAEASI